MQHNPTTASLPPQFEHFASVASSTPASLDQAANPRHSPGMEGTIDNWPPETMAQLEARESSRATKPGIEAMEREAMVRRKQKKRDEMKYGGPGALGKCSPGMEDFPGREELMEVMEEMDNDGAAEFLRIRAATKLRKNRDETNYGGPGAPGPVIANRPNPPRANHQKKNRGRKADSAENQILQTDAPGWSEIRMGEGDFDMTFRDDGTIILSTPVATADCAGAPRPSKMLKEGVDTQETPLRS